MWPDTLSCARRGQAAVVAGMFDETATRYQVAIIGPDEQLLATDSKRHPSRPGETFTRGTQSPAAVTERVRLLVAIWYDLNYNAVVHPRARHGGLLAAPTNDRAEYATIHRQAAIGVPVLTATTLIRAASPGIDAIISSPSTAGRPTWTRQRPLPSSSKR